MHFSNSALAGHLGSRRLSWLDLRPYRHRPGVWALLAEARLPDEGMPAVAGR